jgi:hypothetical protein
MCVCCRALIDNQKVRASRRIEALSIVQRLFGAGASAGPVRTQTTLIGLLGAWGPPFRPYHWYSSGTADDGGPGLNGDHYTHQIHSCGPALKERVTRVFREVYERFALLLKSKECQPLLRVFLIDAFAINWRRSDHSFLMKQDIFPALRVIADAPDPAAPALSGASSAPPAAAGSAGPMGRLEAPPSATASSEQNAVALRNSSIHETTRSLARGVSRLLSIVVVDAGAASNFQEDSARDKASEAAAKQRKAAEKKQKEDAERAAREAAHQKHKSKDSKTGLPSITVGKDAGAESKGDAKSAGSSAPDRLDRLQRSILEHLFGQVSSSLTQLLALREAVHPLPLFSLMHSANSWFVLCVLFV